MPTKRRRVTRSPRPEISPAALFLLMTGRFAPPVGVFGWVGLHFEMQPYDHSEEDWRVATVTPAVAAMLDEEARLFGFIPWGLSGRVPRGAGVKQWTRQFIAQHRRQPVVSHGDDHTPS